MSIIKGLTIRLTTWTEVKEKFNYPENDNNDGYEYGFEFEPDENGFEPMEAQWFRTESEMYTFINRNDLKILHKVI